jgi:hypothetical protein
MSDRNQQLQAILHHIDRIETELRLLRQVIGDLIDNHEERDPDLILVDAELVIPEDVIDRSQTSLQEPRIVVPEGPRTLSCSELRQEARWRAQNWAIREREARAEREALEQLRRETQQDRN